jgi:ketosteroid isomerase-like protein
MKNAILAVLSLCFGAASAAAEDPGALTAQVRAAEIAFAKSMADRDIKAFAALVADDAVFFGRNSVSRGKSAIVESWRGLFDGPKAQFSWAPEDVQVLDSGKLAHSSGPVRDANGKQFGVYNSIWRRETDGSWKVVFDKGCDVCECAVAEKQ